VRTRPRSASVPRAHAGEAAARALRVPIARPSFGDEERKAIQEPLESGWVVQGPNVELFEERFRSFVGAEHAVATTSCTTALHLGVAILGLHPGDEVVVPAFTWVSTANVVEYMGATPIFCDIDLDTDNLNPRLLEERISERTVGIIPVHMFGLCADMAAVNEIASRHGLWVLEDAACAFGALQHGHHAGTLGDMGAFSFHPRKAITTGEGGMLTTGRADRAELARILRDHGADRTDLERHESRGAFLLADYNRLGYNYRMTDIQGALGCAQMERAEWILSRRRHLAARYDDALADLSWLATPRVSDGDVHGYQSYVCLFSPEEPRLARMPLLHERRNALMLALEQRGIATRQGTHAPVATGYYSRKYELSEGEFPAAVLAERLSIALPLYPDMTDDDLDMVVDELRRAYEEY
jgi:perosamine synthetase